MPDPQGLGATAVAIDGRHLICASRAKGIRRRALEVGDLSVPRLRARYDRRRGRMSGRVSHRRAEHVFVSISGRQIGAECTGTYDNDLGFTRVGTGPT